MVDRSGLETSSQPTELTAELAESLPAPSPTWRVLVRLLRWHKPAGRLILLVPALWALVLASAGNPPVLLLAIITLGSFVASAMGCVVNDLWDRNIDPHVERTRHRGLSLGQAEFSLSAVDFGVGLGVCGFNSLEYVGEFGSARLVTLGGGGLLDFGF